MVDNTDARCNHEVSPEALCVTLNNVASLTKVDVKTIFKLHRSNKFKFEISSDTVSTSYHSHLLTP